MFEKDNSTQLNSTHQLNSRARFLQVFAGAASGSVLAACSGGAPQSLPSILSQPLHALRQPNAASSGQPILADNAQIQSLLYRQGLFGIGQNGIGVVRRDMLGNAAFVKSITKPKPAMVSCGCNYGGQTFELQYNGIPIGLVTYAEGSSFASYGYVNPEDPTLFSFASAFGCDGFTTYGPVLAGLAQAMKRCALEQFDSIAKALRQIASWIVASTSALAVSLGSKMKFWAKSFLANAINAVEFAETLLSTLRVVLAWPEIVAAAIGAAVGLTVWDLVNFVWCSTHA